MNKEPFYELIRRQTLQWELIDNGLIEEEKQVRPFTPKQKRIKKEAKIEIIPFAP